VTHGWRGGGKGGETGEWSWLPEPFTLPRNFMHPALLPLMRTPRLPVVDWTDSPADLNGLVRFAERINLVSARAITFQKQSTNCLLFKFSVHGVTIRCFLHIIGRRRKEGWKALPHTNMQFFSLYSTWQKKNCTVAIQETILQAYIWCQRDVTISCGFGSKVTIRNTAVWQVKSCNTVREGWNTHATSRLRVQMNCVTTVYKYPALKRHK
jgi:hypothetical protein